MKTTRKLAVYYKYREQELEIRNNLMELFNLYENYRQSNYKSLGNYLRYEGYQSIANRIIYIAVCGKPEEYEKMMNDIKEISKELYSDLQYIFKQNYSAPMLFKKVKIVLYYATHLTK